MPRGSIIIAGGRPPLPPPLKMIGNFMLTKEFFLVFENCIFWAIYKKKSKYLELRGFMSTPKNNFKQEDNFFGIQHTQGDSMALVLSILRFKQWFSENIWALYTPSFALLQSILCLEHHSRILDRNAHDKYYL